MMDKEEIKKWISVGWNLREWYIYHPEQQEFCREKEIERLVDNNKKREKRKNENHDDIINLTEWMRV
jgi:hypothetical protein